MNEDVIAEAQAAASDAEIVIESVADVGVVAAKQFLKQRILF